MIAVFGALAPIFLLILLGHGLRRYEWVPPAFWPGADRLTYMVLFPALIVDELARADLGRVDVAPMAAAMAAGILGAGALMVGVRRPLTLDGPAFASVFQGSMRMNTYVGLAAAGTLYGAAGRTLLAVGIALIIPLVNVLAVLAHARWGRDSRGVGAGAIAAGLATNPIILAAAAGAALNLSGVGAPPVAGAVIEILARAALPVGLLAVGAGLDLAAARAAGRGVAVATATKLLLVPAITAAAGLALGVHGLALTVAVLFNALPCSASAYALARQMGGDHGLIAAVITVQTLLAALTLPLVLAPFG
ncbi:AEC family transporter [Azospirillum halopraeferens]|uniref:AEC family transporter n=1 Tax=Azospirillum halopraeferens TaxID=34010 RepID=UPI000420C5B4|nr:AEC family transporter [Azospirillum halopraeferens]